MIVCEDVPDTVLLIVLEGVGVCVPDIVIVFVGVFVTEVV